jgi:hypothetical protein
MKTHWSILSALLLGTAVFTSAKAGAATVFNNPWSSSPAANCMFSTTCGPGNGKPNDYAAQAFTLSTTSTITSASFTEWDTGIQVTGANWLFLNANGVGGLPGTALNSGTASISSSSQVGTTGVYDVHQENFNIGTVTLGPGSYYFAVQGISSDWNTFLSSGTASSGAAETYNGTTWHFSYEGIPSVAVGLYTEVSAVPEPSTWAMMLLGFAGVGFMAYRRKAKPALFAA